MLTIKTLKGGGAAAHYYSQEGRNPDRRADEYYGEVRDQVAPTWWTPRGSLGVENGAQVRPEELREAMAGRDPAGSGGNLIRYNSEVRHAVLAGGD